MTFLLPLGLLALLTLPIILILHLLRERRRRMAVPSLLHWQNLPRKREGERIRRLPLTLLLLLHLLVAALIGLALGRPQLVERLQQPCHVARAAAGDDARGRPGRDQDRAVAAAKPIQRRACTIARQCEAGARAIARGHAGRCIDNDGYLPRGTAQRAGQLRPA